MLRELLVAFGIVAVCVVIHTTSMVIFAEWLIDRRHLVAQRTDSSRNALRLISVFAFIIALHVTGTVIWAIFYYKQGLFQDFESSLYFSLSSYTTIGYGDVVLPGGWRLLGSIEGLSGVLLCGLSTAFIFAIVNSLLQMRTRKQSNDEQ